VPLRVTAGLFRGRKLEEFKGRDIRPVTAVVREAFFNIVDVFGLTFLDLFAGTGVMGIEALSRGAEFVVFVDANLDAVKLIKSNLNRCKVSEDKYTILKMSVSDFLASPVRKKYDVVFFDPPFPVGMWYSELASCARVVNNDGIVVVKNHKTEYLPDKLGLLEKVDARKYGSSGLTFYRLIGQ